MILVRSRMFGSPILHFVTDFYCFISSTNIKSKQVVKPYHFQLLQSIILDSLPSLSNFLWSFRNNRNEGDGILCFKYNYILFQKWFLLKFLLLLKYFTFVYNTFAQIHKTIENFVHPRGFKSKTLLERKASQTWNSECHGNDLKYTPLIKTGFFCCTLLEMCGDRSFITVAQCVLKYRA